MKLTRVILAVAVVFSAAQFSDASALSFAKMREEASALKDRVVNSKVAQAASAKLHQAGSAANNFAHNAANQASALKDRAVNSKVAQAASAKLHQAGSAAGNFVKSARNGMAERLATH